MLDRPVIIEKIDALGLELIGTVHRLPGTVPGILREVERFSPGQVCVELSDPGQATGSFEVEAVRIRHADKLKCIDRPIRVTALRYMSGTGPTVFLRETLAKYFFLPLNVLSIAAFNRLAGPYLWLTRGRFYTFGWSRRDTMFYIYERDEYMAGTLAESIRSGAMPGGRLVIVGRRHVAGMKCILEAFLSTNDIGSYYAGGKVYEVFSLADLLEPSILDDERSSRNFLWNRSIEAAIKVLIMPAYLVILFLIAAAAAYITLKILT